MKRKISNIFFGLWRTKREFFKDTWIAAKRIHHVFKYGYPEQATWDTYSWFTVVMTDILKEYREFHNGYPSGKSAEEWNAEIDMAIHLLHEMDETNPKYEDIPLAEQMECQIEAKDEFMRWFSVNFFNLWD